MGLMNSPIWVQCLEKDHSATYVLVTVATAYLRFCRLGRYFVQPGDNQDCLQKDTTYHMKCRVFWGWNRWRYIECHGARVGLDLPFMQSIYQSSFIQETAWTWTWWKEKRESKKSLFLTWNWTPVSFTFWLYCTKNIGLIYYPYLYSYLLLHVFTSSSRKSCNKSLIISQNLSFTHIAFISEHLLLHTWPSKPGRL